MSALSSSVENGQKVDGVRALDPWHWLDRASVVDLLGATQYENKWKLECRIIPNYLPPYPNKHTRARVVVQFGESFLRHSAGPLQGWFWDVYGDDLQTVGLAVRAIIEAPRPFQSANASKSQPVECAEESAKPK
jgi:hypothetical protein